MKNIFFNLIIVFLLVTSCKSQVNENLIIDFNNVKEIKVINKVDCSMHNLKGRTKIITDKSTIKNIVDALTLSEEINKDVNMKMSNGFFEIDFYEGAKNHYYTINYTIYDGVIVRNDNNGIRYKNDRLEIVIYKIFEN